ncbi:hypothetical protein LSH36_1455g00009 [Paralvinella palmiformis]|uniref:G-protein coupled receptors family 1 profile domain-containing protein n=1 Tax=Paralvinella palmiformis TaxID=53620 RepID=A0AAD9MRB1_9ANNE|nr:hypothetical protein LSH36_1455g00009 [Paralvinella palmiformis]
MSDPYEGYDEKARSVLRSLGTVPDDVAVCGLVLGSLCSISALIGNILILIVFLSERSLRQRQNTFVVSAAIAEVLLVFLKDVYLLGVWSLRSWRFGDTIMQVCNVIFICRNGIAIGHVVAVTVYRYVLIVHPRAYRILSKTSVILITLLLLFFIPLISSLGVLAFKFFFNTKVMFCIRESKLGIHNGTLVEENMGGDPIPSFLYVSINAVILIFCNVHIYLFIKRSSQRVANATVNNATGDGTNGKQTLSKRATKKEVRFVKIMAIIFGTFLVSYYVLPAVIMLDKQWSLSHWVYFPFVVINWFSSSINWIVYSLTHSGFRRSVQRILRCRWKAKLMEESTIDQTQTD